MVGDDCILGAGVEHKAIYIYANTNSYMIIYIFGGNCLFGLPARSTTSPQKKSDSTFSRKMMLGSPESVEVVPYRSGLSFTPLGEPTNPKVGPTVLNGGGGVCRFEVNSHYFIFAIETYQPPKTNSKIRRLKLQLILLSFPIFWGPKKKTAFTSGDELLEGKNFGKISRSPLGLATPRLDTCASWHRSPPLPRPGVRKRGNLPVAAGGSGGRHWKGWEIPREFSKKIVASIAEWRCNFFFCWRPLKKIHTA